jgi:2-polyprenyl-6-methoxyphenol hydroxylase-like FAD-dependent oxidoreductase
MPSPRIAVIGAGPGGLTLACILQAAGRDVEVFEADDSTMSRDQGGTLDLHPDTGQKALELVGLKERFLELARPEDQDKRVIDYKTGELLFEEIVEPGSGDKPEIDRKALRELMLSPLRPGTVRWGHRLEEIRPVTGSARHELVFDNGFTDSFDLVIGADGAFSRVRALLTDVGPVFTGINFIECWLNDVDTAHPDIAKLVGHGTVFAFHDNQGMFAQRNGFGHVRVYIGFRRPESWAADNGVDFDDPDNVRAHVRKLYAGWSPLVLNWVEKSLDRFIGRLIYTLPADFGWKHRPGVTLIGDAAHLMPPVGLGVNLAMLDAAELALAIRDEEDWKAAVARMDAAIQARASVHAAGSIKVFGDIYSDDAPKALIALFRSAMAS